MLSDRKNNLTYRYPGTKPFSESEKTMFFGRDADTASLYSLIYIKQGVVLYGKSGYGKSSLINAGIIPILKANNEWDCFNIRFNNYTERDDAASQNMPPIRTARQRLKDGATVGPNILDTLIPGEGSLWYLIKARQWYNKQSKFILFFDQFEELFSYPKDQVDEFSAQLADLLYTTLPLNFRQRVAEADENEELSDELYRFLHERPEVKVVFSIRSDRLSLLNNLTDRHPAILQHCYELDALNADDAEKAIVQPAMLPREMGFDTPEFTYTTGAVNKIINSVKNRQWGKIEGATLQIICRYIERQLVGIGNLNPVKEDDLGDVTAIFTQYYQSILNALTDEERNKAQYLIEDELIDGDRRNPLTESYISKKFGLTDELLGQLEESSLLRKERDAAGRILYEVSHDSLIMAINNVAADRRKQEEEARKLLLEHEVQAERKRADEHMRLYKRSRVLTVITGMLALVGIIIAVYAFVQKEQAQHMEKLANEQSKVANKATAGLLMEFADDQANERTYESLDSNIRNMIKDYYAQALIHMKDQKSDSLYTEIQQKLNRCLKKD